MALGVPTKEEANIRGFKEIHNQLIGVARNLNQMTRAANAGKLVWQSGERKNVERLEQTVIEVKDLFLAYEALAAKRSFVAALEEMDERRETQ